MNQTKKAALIILDGWGIGRNDTKVNAIAAAKKPFFDSLMMKYPHGSLKTFGENVGLPEGQMGNSEVGHLNIGAGRVVYQMLALINKAFSEHTIDTNEVLLKAFEEAKTGGKNLHLIGLVSDGGVHSHINHLKGLTTLAKEHGLENVYIHAFTDGRDTDPKAGAGYLRSLEDHLAQTTGKISTIIGRYYAMDRDHRWERVKLAYDLITGKHADKQFRSAREAMEKSYQEGITDEFIKPIALLDDEGKPMPTIQENDVVIFFNFRTDRGRQLVTALTQEDFPDQEMKKMQLRLVTFTQYDRKFENVDILFPENDLVNTIGEVVEKAGLSQMRAAETEKYPHVTFFFSGGREKEFDRETRVMVASPKVATYDLKPSMSAAELTFSAIETVDKSHPDFIVLNYANADMVGHTGVFSAVMEAVETVDTCLKTLVYKLQSEGYGIVIIADHGNADFMVNADGSPNTAHTTNLVPVIVIGEEAKEVRNGILADVAPTLLKLMRLEQPAEMTGKSMY